MGRVSKKMEVLLKIFDFVFPDGIIYGLTGLIFLLGLFKCCRPVLRNAAALRRAMELLEDGARANLARPVWVDVNFLGKRMQPVWKTFLHNAELARSRGMTCDVADFVNDDSVITNPGKAPLADLVPGLCTSLGILGTFVGLVRGLSGLDVMNVDSYTRLTGGISFAFYTSIVGIIGSLAFNVIHRHAVGRAVSSIDKFIAAFYTYAIPQPADASTQLLTYQHEQSSALSQFAQDLSVHMAGEVHRAVLAAMTPVQRSMEDFLNAATRAQVDGLDFIVGRFIDRMNAMLDGKLRGLGEAIAELTDGNLRAQADLGSTIETISQLTRDVTAEHQIAQETVAKFAEYVATMEAAGRQISDAQGDTVDLLETLNEASTRQARYLAALQEYQAKLQGSFQDYTVWTDQFVGGLEDRTTAQNKALEHVGAEMHESATLLQGAYKSFVEAIELGLANALGLFDENMQGLTRQIHSTLSEIQSTMTSLEKSMTRAANAATTDREVS
ncbi:hypothetical protein FACS1894196_2630 [Clostridia bacterium]|nr:hypothetical protein FACS1894196_2630 [Clostridia bacterium]